MTKLTLNKCLSKLDTIIYSDINNHNPIILNGKLDRF